MEGVEGTRVANKPQSVSLRFSDGHGLIVLALGQLLNLIAPLASVFRDVVFLVSLNMTITERISIVSSARKVVVCGWPQVHRPVWSSR